MVGKIWAQCSPPPNCGNSPQLYCESPYADFNWAIVPDGDGNYNIYAERAPETGAAVSFCLMLNNVVEECISGNSVVFTKKLPLCYTLVICIQSLSGTGPSAYCCVPLPCMAQGMDCCELSYHFYSNVASPLWTFGDNTTSTDQNPVHEYSNINSYPNEGTPTAAVTLSSGGVVQFQQQVVFPEGIWIGKDCQNAGNASSIVNSVNPSLFVLPGLDHFGKSISVKGSVTMDLDYKFTKCDFCMNPSSRILGNTPILSFLDETILHEAYCKSKAWYGVELRSGSITGVNAKFEGAYNAIITRPSHNWTSTVLRLTGCQFERNYLGINASAPLSFAVFDGNRFGNENSMLDWPGLEAASCSWVAQINKPTNSQPFAGIYAETPSGQAAITIGFPNLNVGINRFVNLSNGIYLNDANGQVIRRCQFKNMLSGGYPNDDGMGIALFTSNYRRLTQTGLGKASTDLTFENCVHAVLVEMPQFSSGNVLLQSYVNNMNNVQHGYTLRGGITATFRNLSFIRNNRINYTGNHGILCENVSPQSRLQINFNRVATANATSFGGVFAANFAPQPLAGSDYRIIIGDNLPTPGPNFEDGIYGGGRGISIGASAHILVQNNNVEDFSTFGIGNATSPEVDIRCNNVSSSSGGNSIQNHMSPTAFIADNQTNASLQGIQFSEASNNSTIQCNQIGSHDVGLYYDASAVVGDQLPGNISGGNTWIGTYSSWAAQQATGGSGLNNTLYFRTGEINPAQISSLNPFWFTQTPLGITCSINSCPAFQKPPRTVSDLDTTIADGTLNPSGLSGYLSKRFLFNDLLYYPTLAQGNSTMQAFQSTHSATNGGKLVAVEKNLADGFNLTPAQQSQWDAAANTLDSISMQLAILDSLLQYGSGQQPQEAQRMALRWQDSTKQAILKAIYNDNLSARVSSAGAILQTLNGISPAAVWESNEKILNSIFANTAFVDQVPNSSQISEILQIAQQCSADGGPAVTRARIWYHTLTGISVSANCYGLIERGISSQDMDKIPVLKISPNPALDNLHLQFFGDLDGEYHIEIFSIEGKLKYAFSLPELSNSTNVSTLDFLNGFYYCRVSKDGRPLSTVKFAVQH